MACGQRLLLNLSGAAVGRCRRRSPRLGAVTGVAAMIAGQRGSVLLTRPGRLLAVFAFLTLLVTGFTPLWASEHLSAEVARSACCCTRCGTS